ncbi:MAG: aldo/keto reductase [Thermoprotei archaeon]
MLYSKLGNTGVKISKITLGSNNFGRQLDRQQSYRVISKALDLGVNSVDTANVYTQGQSERIIGEYIRESRDSVFVASKVGMPLSSEVNYQGLSRKHIQWQLSQTLERLGTKYLDLYYLHRPDPETPILETMVLMDQLVKQGKTLYVGCSNFSAEQMRELLRVCEENDLVKPVAVQPEYNLLERSAEKGLFDLCRSESLSVFTYSPLKGGALTGKYAGASSPPPDTRASANPRYWERIRSSDIPEKSRKLLEASKRIGIPLAQLSIAWILRNPAVSSAIVGASTPMQVEENCRSLELAVRDSDWGALEQATL